MPSSLPQLEILYAALRSQSGVKVPILEGTFEQARQKLYAVRREANDPALDALAFTASPANANEIWIVHKLSEK